MEKEAATTSATKSNAEPDNKIQMKREVGLLEGVAIIICIIIGSGIFVSPAGVIEKVGSVGLSLVVWVLSGLFSIMGALCYAELGTSIPKSGGDYIYIYECYGPLLSFLYLWNYNIILAPVSNAILGLTFTNYILRLFFPTCEIPTIATKLLAAAVICLLTFINCWNVKLTTKIQNVFMFAKVTALSIIVIAGLTHLYTSKGYNFENIWENTTSSPGNVALSFYSCLFCYSGWNYLNFIVDELKDPYRNLPRGIYLSLPLVILIYILVNVAYFSVLTPNQILKSNAIAATFGTRTLGAFSFIVPIMVAIAAFGGLSVHIMVSSRLGFVGAKNGHFPSMLSIVNINCFTPIASLVFLNILSLLSLCCSDVLLLINFSSFISTAFMVLSVSGMLYLRWLKPDMDRPIKISICIPILFVFVSLSLILLSCYVNPMQIITGVLVTLMGVPVYYIGVIWDRKPPAFVCLLQNCTIIIQKLFLSVPEEK